MENVSHVSIHQSQDNEGIEVVSQESWVDTTTFGLERAVIRVGYSPLST